jgi:hypothetical protein
MPDDLFSNACDRISRIVDSGQFERLRWARTEAPMLASLVDLAHAAFSDREEFELTDEGSGHAFRRFVIKVHGIRVFAVRIELSGRTVCVDAEAIERSRHQLLTGEAVTASYDEVDIEWIAAAFAAQFLRVAVKPDCVTTDGTAKAFPKDRSNDRKPDAQPGQDQRQVRPPAARANRPIS